MNLPLRKKDIPSVIHFRWIRHSDSVAIQLIVVCSLHFKQHSSCFRCSHWTSHTSHHMFPFCMKHRLSCNYSSILLQIGRSTVDVPYVSTPLTILRKEKFDTVNETFSNLNGGRNSLSPLWLYFTGQDAHRKAHITQYFVLVLCILYEFSQSWSWTYKMYTYILIIYRTFFTIHCDCSKHNVR